MKQSLQISLYLLILTLLTSSLSAQIETDFFDRQAIITATENFFIGDHTGSIKHKKLSMHEKGAYRWVKVMENMLKVFLIWIQMTQTQVTKRSY